MSQRSINMQGDRNHRWKGGIRTQKNGYIKRMKKGHPRADRDGYVYEHILIMEEKLGRFIPINEDVHHIDGDRGNNDPNNLTNLNHKIHAYIEKNKNNLEQYPNSTYTETLKTCVVDGCNSEFYSLGYCVKHYKRFKTTGDPLKVKMVQDHNKHDNCSVVGCEKRYFSKGLCQKHYDQKRRSRQTMVG